MLHGLLVVLHILVSFVLILVVLLQTGKGADLAGAFGGGGSQTAFGSRGAATVLTKLTTSAAVLFMLTSISLSILSGRGSTSVLENTELPSQQKPAQKPSAIPGTDLNGQNEAASRGVEGPETKTPVAGSGSDQPQSPAEPADEPKPEETSPPAKGPDEGTSPHSSLRN